MTTLAWMKKLYALFFLLLNVIMRTLPKLTKFVYGCFFSNFSFCCQIFHMIADAPTMSLNYIGSEHIKSPSNVAWWICHFAKAGSITMKVCISGIGWKISGRLYLGKSEGSTWKWDKNLSFINSYSHVVSTCEVENGYNDFMCKTM